MSSNIIVPVTPKLAVELGAAGRLLREMSTNGKLNDSDHYAKVVIQLEVLTVAVLSATSSTPLTALKTPDARFSIRTGDPLNEHMHDSVTYLRYIDSELLASGDFSRYNHAVTDTALDYLKTLEGLLRHAIVKAAESDLAKLSQSGITDLLSAASALAKAAAPELKVADQPSEG